MKSKNLDLVLFGALFTGLYVIANFIAARQVEILGLLVTSSFAIYPLTFVISNIVNERLGLKEARKIVLSGIIVMFILMTLLCITYYFPGVKGETEDAYKLLFANNVLVYLSSLIAFTIGQVVNFTIYNGIKANLVVKYFVSTSIALFIDAILFKSMMVYFGVVSGEVFSEVLTHVLFGMLTICIATPIFFIFCYNAKKKAN
jgi:uncharacterized integral membrane protein (TIGR00697 family)